MPDKAQIKRIRPLGRLAAAFEKRRSQLLTQSFSYAMLESELRQKGVEGITVTFERLDVDGRSPRILLMRYRDVLRGRNGCPGIAHLIIFRQEGAKIEVHLKWEAGIENHRYILIPTFTMTGGEIPEQYLNVDLNLLLTTAFGFSNVTVDYEGDVLGSESLDQQFGLLKSFFAGAYASNQDVTSWLQEALRALEIRSQSS